MADYDPFKPFKRKPAKRDEDRTPFDDIFGSDFFGQFDAEFRRTFEQMSRLVEGSMKEGIKPGRSFVQGFSITMGPDGKPIIQQFGDKPVQAPQIAAKKVKGEAPKLESEREPLVDVLECGDDVTVTVEMPGVEKEDVDLSVTDDTLSIKAQRGDRHYSKKVRLPCPVLPDTTKATYKNGILDVVIKRAEKKDEGKKVKVQ
ncbi:MAG: Hsp20/alpha crystallin family protein [Candidatus Thermoplasmatota archaeon]|nr:Hsp20/alpha crystallin family protein [Candidatus Thermoplasmatota archaeon]